MPWREATPMSERLSLCCLADEGKYSISELARGFGVSRKTAYKWIRRFKQEGQAGIFDRSRRPLRSPSRINSEIEDAVMELAEKYPMWGPRKLHCLVADKLGEECPSKSTVGRMLARKGLSDARDVSALQEAALRFERGKPNDLWQIDFAASIALSGGSKLWPVPILDDHSRYCVGLSAAVDCSGTSALSALTQACRRCGLPNEILSDHGSAFGVSPDSTSAFGVYLWALGIHHTQGRYAHPQTQGKLERFNRTLRKECIGRHDYTNIQDWNECFEDYRRLYNEVRPHQALGDKTPASRYVPSQKAFAEPDKDHRESGEGLVHRRVDASGRIWLLQHRVKVGNGFSGWVVAAKHEGNGVWTVQFRGQPICQAVLTKLAPYRPRP
jgi:transposase InsO family protein